MGLKNHHPSTSSWRSPQAVATTSHNNNDNNNNNTTNSAGRPHHQHQHNNDNGKLTVHKRGNTAFKAKTTAASSTTSHRNHHHRNKHTLDNDKKNAKKIKFHSASCADTAQQETSFLPLDVTVPQQAHKLLQRQKAIAKGKNTLGYDCYRRQVPLAARKKWSMDTPTTPDATLDMPNRQWNGMVKAWRLALHKYDPVDLHESFAKTAAAAQQGLDDTNNNTSTTATTKAAALTVKEQELEQAKSNGLLDLVHVEDNSSRCTRGRDTATAMPQEETDPTAAAAAAGSREMSLLDEWERARGDDDVMEDDMDDMLSDNGVDDTAATNNYDDDDDESDDDLL